MPVFPVIHLFFPALSVSDHSHFAIAEMLLWTSNEYQHQGKVAYLQPYQHHHEVVFRSFFMRPDGFLCILNHNPFFSFCTYFSEITYRATHFWDKLPFLLYITNSALSTGILGIRMLPRHLWRQLKDNDDYHWNVNKMTIKKKMISRWQIRNKSSTRWHYKYNFKRRTDD